MRVLINGLAALKPKTGVGHTLVNLVENLRQSFSEDEFTLYPGAQLSRVVRRFQERSQGASKSKSRPARSSTPREILAAGLGHVKTAAKFASQFHFTAYSRTFGFDLYHEPNFVPFASHLPTVVTVHDLSVLLYPQWHPADRVRAHERRFLKGLQQAQHVIVVSESVRQEMIAHLSFPAERITAIHNGISTSFRPHSTQELESARTRLNLPRNYLLCVGTIEPRKNIATVMRAYAELPESIRTMCPLVLVGPWGWKSEREREFFEQTGRSHGIIHVGYLADVDLPPVYAGATALIYPSYYEGFGLPPIEMLASGGVVLASTATAIREVCGSHAQFIEPEDMVGWKRAMTQVITDADFREELRRGNIEHASQFSWRKAALETMSVYRQVLKLSNPVSQSSTRSAA